MKRAMACILHGAVHVEIDVDGVLLVAGARPDQYDLLLASLAACTALTLQAFAADKGWPLQTLDIYLALDGGAAGLRVERRLFMTGIDATAQAVLLELASLTPVTLLLGKSIAISTALVRSLEGSASTVAP